MRRAVVAVTVAFLALSCSSGFPDPVTRPSSRLPSTEGWTRANLSIVGLSVGVPPGWHVQRLVDDLGYTEQYALIVSNGPFDAGARGSYPTLWDMSKQPRDLVAVMLGNDPEARPCGSYPRDASFPYTARDVTGLEHWEDDFGRPDLGSLYSYIAGIDRQALVAHLWFGGESSDEDMTLGAAAITTLARIPGWSTDCHATWNLHWGPRQGS